MGMLNDPVQNAAVTLAAPVLLAFNAVNNLFGVGSSSMMSRAMGKKRLRYSGAELCLWLLQRTFCGILLSLLYSVYHTPFLHILGADTENIAVTGEYLKWTTAFGAAPAILNVVMAYLVRSEGFALHASIGTISGCLLNMILDPVFILPWGLDLGAAGAGLATCLSNCAACLYFFILLAVRRGKTHVCVHPGRFKPTKAIVLGICGVGIPAAIQNLLNVTGMTVLNNFTSAYGSNAVAAMGIAQKINMIPPLYCDGAGAGHYAADQLQLFFRRYQKNEKKRSRFP